MVKNKIYSGYKAYQYLKPDVDYKAFELDKALDRFETYWVPLSKAEEERAEGLLEKSIVISMHEHPVLLPKNVEKEYIEYESEGREFIAYDGLSKSYLDGVFDDMMDGTAFITSKEGWKWDDVIYDLGLRLCDIAHQDFIVRCETVNDILEAHKTGRLALIPSVEGAAPIENEVDRIEILYGLGVRKLGITYSESNALGSGRDGGPRGGGLTDFGYDCIKRMNKIGMAIDVSHCNDQTALDSIEISDKPIMISHSSARTLFGPNARSGFPDEVFIKMAEKGGVAGICAAPHSTWTKNKPEHTIDSYMEHMEYCINLIGIDHVGAGPDTIYGDHATLHDIWFNQKGRSITRWRNISMSRSENTIKPKKVTYVKGMENPTEAIINIARWLVKHGYSDHDIQKAIGGNTLKLLKSVWWR